MDDPLLYSHEPSMLSKSAKSLLQRAWEGHDDKYGSGSMSCAPYDTAWVSLITKTTGGEKRWLFPECFEFILRGQSDDGSWGTDSNSQIDGILNTAASLLSLKRHREEPFQIRDIDQHDLNARIERATLSLRLQLNAWSVSTTLSVGFEIIMPAMLRLLENEGITFDFEGRVLLETISASKLANFSPELLYRTRGTTAIHSLEAFIGMIDFDQVSHHKVNGSMMGSPSSTAAYLLNASRWDEDCETYLRHVIVYGAGKGGGGVPSAYPSTHFEYSWILSSLLDSGFSAFDLQCTGLEGLQKTLETALTEECGTIGFAPDFEHDVDDTAKAITCLGKLGLNISPDEMITAFEGDHHFRTYPLERNPSFSANCNVMRALLNHPNASLYRTQIRKLFLFACNYWWDSDGNVADKWSSSNLYSILLFTEAFIDILAFIDNDSPSWLSNEELLRGCIALFQACLRVMLQQNEDGSWSDSAEETAYGVLTLCAARRLRFFDDIRDHLDSAISRGAAVLESSETGSRDPKKIWIEKVSYASPLIAEAYRLAALKSAESPSATVLGSILWHDCLSTKPAIQIAKLFKKTPLFSQIPEWEIHASLIEATLFVPLLQARRLEVFPRTNMEDDKYFTIIPCTWTCCNNRSRTFSSTRFLYDMMILSFLNYQVDEFMEAVAGPMFVGRIPELKRLVSDLFFTSDSRQDTSNNGIQNGVKIGPKRRGDISENYGNEGEDFHDQEVSSPLHGFVKHVLHHPSVLSASAGDRSSLKRELQTFLLAHVKQVEDNLRLNKQQSGGIYTDARISFFRWVRTTAADHTSCPYSFSFVSCLLGSKANSRELGCFGCISEKYYSAAACQHLATMCRMYNDYGSVSRDQAEGNLNSINFPDFGEFESSSISADSQEGSKKKELFGLAEYERACLGTALNRLENAKSTHAKSQEAKELAQRQMVIWRLFCDVTDLYGQIYVVRDIASRKVVPGAAMEK